MVAKINRSANLYGALKYNQDKVDNKNATILSTNRIIENGKSDHRMSDLLRSFEPYLIANQKTEKPAIHISLNPDPNDLLGDKTYAKLADDYMREMGYGNQPYVVYKHMDIDRTHLHIVTVAVDEEGKKISDAYEKVRSTKLCRTLEKEFGLHVATDKESLKNEKIFHPVDYRKGNIKSQMASIIRHIPKYYQFQSLGEYNALLLLFNLMAEKVEAVGGGISRQGLVYIALDESGNKVSLPIKASLFGKQAGLSALENHYNRSRENFKNNDLRNQLKKNIQELQINNKNEVSFKKVLKDFGINLVVRRNDEGRIFGVTFIDHNSRTVCNGSRLGKDFSANVFNELWNKGNQIQHDSPALTTTQKLHTDNFPETRMHPLFSFLNTDQKHEESFIDGLGSILPLGQVEDYEELAFENSIKKKKRKR